MNQTVRRPRRKVAAALGVLALFGTALASPSLAGPFPPVNVTVGSTQLNVDGPATDGVEGDYYDDNGTYVGSTPTSTSPADSSGLVSSDAPDPGDSLVNLPDPDQTMTNEFSPPDNSALVVSLENLTCKSGEVCGTPRKSGCVSWHVWHTQYDADGFHKMYTFNVDVHFCFKSKHICTCPDALRVETYLTDEDPVVDDLGNVAPDDEYYYQYWDNVSNSGHASKVKRHIEYCVGGDVGCYTNKYPWIHEYVHGDGTMYFHTGG
jgi:hypothetical protein